MALTLRLSDSANERLRDQAQREQRPLTAVIEDAVIEYVERRSLNVRVDAALDVVVPRYADLLDRLGKA